ncbi:hypothetical protein, partial [Klebsiella pneumoniae]|uniref:hypothetical protein n=1 Tax=Klebsiella pneumoniae TaxID=573 RepID=UPI001EF993CD
AGAQLAAIREVNPARTRINAYFQGWTNALIAAETLRRTLAANQELSAADLMTAARSIQNFDTGGLIGVPASLTRNSI